ncbi:MAG: DNA/RNA non-specific endonuclease [Lentisphaeria bacterium]|nr:DNA/RNA non-specific endonuclease [Lentisphaeria bacterium]
MGTPQSSFKLQTVKRVGYALGYSEKYEQPLWVSYKLTKNEAQSKVAKRTNKFKADPKVSTESASLKDYRKSGYDRGHLAPAGDMAWSKQAMNESFYLSNMSPQVPKFNRGVWKKLESLVRKWSVIDEELYVITGPIFSKNPKVIGTNHVAIPTAYYKIVIDDKPPGLKAIAFILPNKGSKEPLSHFVVSIDQVEEITGLDFLNKLPKALEQKFERSKKTNLWNFKPKYRKVVSL